MPELLLHVLTGYLIGRWFKRRWGELLLVVIASILPDVDALFRIHRSITHSLVLAFLAGLVVLFLTRLISSRWFTTASLAVAAYAIHVFMDLFTGPTPILWPFLREGFYIDVGVYVSNTVLNGLTLKPVLDVSTTSYVMEYSDIVDAPIATPTGIPISVVVFVLVLVDRLRGRGSPRRSST